ncbi:MAG: type II toxin-antitoxin system RelE/ParE family toxin [Bryobacterales bacterium]|nr:type II toxin-antitoxin system RelE/ParE family toxin [Bryobacterales bacterium]
MKKFEVIVTPEAQAGIRKSFLYIHERSPLNAARWIEGLYDEIDTLERFPERCSYAREREYLEEDLRQLVYKSHRVVFYVDKPKHTVYVLYVRHARRRAVGESEGTDDD